ncbi:YbaB/EbfC family nucleoid-associated protein [Ligilactobacillus ceti]|uniref:Nucleoid-associated protein IV53_GL000441 n=1 Tax=Ligilactobacillus ceti DSM 22408 TaxID=1122146 RepID=A0A0R2KQJ5_9LACO|nr:YbaB/EbfC family nucleoid-associated protein [Ligilactobacillus ceti]KRN88477.1 hypothetical protein IV53_GL000441 [Ligilactobacillus ceti DSM 22408]
MRGMNMQGMMKQMQKMQKNMQKDQAALNETVFTGQAPNDLVIAKMTGDKKLQDIEISPDVVDPEDVDMLQDFVIAAVNDALVKVEAETEKTMGKYARNIPGF